MMTFAEQVAVELLRRDGLKAVWELHVVASNAHRAGQQDVATGLLQVADAAEAICSRNRDCGEALQRRFPFRGA
jgi:hypothetical protein